MKTMTKTGIDEREPNFKVCKHVRDIGSMAVYVEPTCKGPVHSPRGVLVVSKGECRRCCHCERKEA